MRRALLWAATVLALLPAATQANPGTLIRDCLKNGKITGTYSAKDYSQALANLPTDIAEYSNCSAVIRNAQLSNAALSGNSRSNGGAAGSAATNLAAAPRPASTLQDPLAAAAPADRRAVIDARRSGASPLRVGGALIRPGAVAVGTSSFIHTLPTPLLLALGALLCIVLSAGGRRIWDLVRARRSA